MNGSIYDMRNTHYVIFATPKEQSTIVLGVANKMETGWFRLPKLRDRCRTYHEFINLFCYIFKIYIYH